MTVWRRSPVHPLCLLVGALLFGSAGLASPSTCSTPRPRRRVVRPGGSADAPGRARARV